MACVGLIKWTCITAFYTLHSAITCANRANRPIDRSCVDSSDWYGTGVYDPDGDGGVGPFSIKCEGDNLVFYRVNQARTHVDGYAPNSYTEQLDYHSNGVSVSLDQVRAAVKRAILCRYWFRVECVGVSFHTDGHWIDYNGDVVNWQDTAGTFCQYETRNCNCHDSSSWTEDEGFLDDVHRFPIKTLVFGGTVDNNQDMYYALGPLSCRMAKMLLPASQLCLDASLRHLVDYECDVTSPHNVTVIHHDREQRTFVNGYETAGSFSAPLTYQSFSGDRTLNIDDVYQVVKQASSCEYRLNVNCHGCSLDDGWLVPYDTAITSVPYANTTVSFCRDDNGLHVCNRDGSNNVIKGYIRDLQYFPIRDLRFGDTGGISKWLYYILGPLRCVIPICSLLTTTLASTPSCVDSDDVAASGDYDPDGDGGVTPFPVECDGESVVIHHNRETRTFVNGYWEYIAPLEYMSNGFSVSLDQVRALIKRATNCSYYIKTECIEVNFDYTYWVTYNGEAAAWVETGGTFCQYTSRYCNCHESSSYVEDEGYLEDTHWFPIKTLVFGDTYYAHKEMYYTLGPLKCAMALRIKPAFGFCLETAMRHLLDFECDVTTYPHTIIIHHDREQRIFVSAYEGPGSSSEPLTYQSFSGDRTFNIDDVYKVVQLATSCEYQLTVECHKVDMTKGWLVPYNSTVSAVPYDQTTGTFCISEDDSGQRTCECSIQDNTVESGFIRDLQHFPIRDLRFGDTGDADEWLYYTLGPLRCIISKLSI